MRILDLFCGAGGAAMGYHRAGFEVIGVDHIPMPHFPFQFHQGDALEFALAYADSFDVIHASPPCQGYSRMNQIHKREYPLLIDDVREAIPTNMPYIIENVVGAPLRNPVLLCGTMFGLQVTRHRQFESNLPLRAPAHAPHEGTFYTPAGHGEPNQKRRTVNASLSGVGYTQRCREAMGIDWMNRDELAQAIPPAYTEYLGFQLRAALEVTA